MRLKELLSGICETEISDFEVTKLCWDNRKEIPHNSLFVCIEGKTFDAHSVAHLMLEKGAGAVVTNRSLGLDREIVVKDTREALSLLCANWFLNPQKKLKLIGITGTNGKTTTATTVKRLLTAHGFKTGLIGTCDVEIGDEIYEGERSNPTTPEPYELFEIFNCMADKGCEYAVMEVSSQGLEQKRVFGCEYEAGVFTNLTQDHLDVHGTMENYYQAKKMLFDISKIKLSNLDDEWGNRLFSETKNATSFSSQKKADYYADEIILSANGCEYCVNHNNEKYNTFFKMPGEFNVSNSLVALAVCDKLGFSLEKSAQLLKNLDGVCGRAEVVSKDVDFTVIRDYAHSPDAVEKILKAIRAVSKGRVICLFGCGGNRDAKKRPLMAIAAAENSDFCIVTSDNPRNEDPEMIISDILVGMENQTTPYVKITDRKEAIRYALENAKTDDVIAIVGKGHEDYQILKDGVKIHFDEKEIVEEILLDMKNR